MSNSTCLRADLENSNIGSVHKSQAPSKKKSDGGLSEVAYLQPKATQKHHPFRASGCTQNTQGTDMKCKANCAPGGTLSKTRLASCSGGILAGSTGGIHWRILASRSGSTLAWPARDTQLDIWRDLLVHWRAALVEYSAGSTGKPLWRDTWRDPLASRSGGILGGIHWPAVLAGYWVGVWCRSIASADSNNKSNNPFLSGEKNTQSRHTFSTTKLTILAKGRLFDLQVGAGPPPSKSN